ncbi:MAG: hypothetical protein IEMM0008_0024 [bacterium]|nr:MAG: hypothetical protein IEMM0008_0024 [bacterium]
MKKRYIYFYLVSDDPAGIQNVIPHHINFWMGQQLEDYSGGPFTDRSGGMITFMAKDMDEAQSVIFQDPFIQSDLIVTKYIKEWLVEESQGQ